MPKKKKKNRRSQQKYPDLDAKYNLKTRADLIDQDYLEKLSPKDLAWLNKFNKEYINASFDHKKPIHKAKRHEKESYDRNNARNRDILTREKAKGMLSDFESLYDYSKEQDYEDNLIKEIDLKEAKAAIEFLAEELERDGNKLEKQLINESLKKGKP